MCTKNDIKTIICIHKSQLFKNKLPKRMGQIHYENLQDHLETCPLKILGVTLR